MRIMATAALHRMLAAALLLILSIGCVGLAPSDAEANAGWKSLKGYSECGGVDSNGKLQPACGFTRATKVGKALGTCPKGSFFDLGTWSCYTCPSGYNRNARDISGDRACDRAATPTQTSAKFLGAKDCPAGSILDGRNGGECWSCPAGYGRTAASVDAHNACGMIGKTARTAVFKGRACPEGSFTDPRNGGECWTCPDGFNRTANAVTSNKACSKVLDFSPATKEAALTCEAGQIFDFVDGGSCWTCPDNSRRSISGVKTAKACEYKSFVWKSPDRAMPGLFGLGSGAEEIAAQLIAARTEIDAAIARSAKKTNQNVATVSAAVWKVIEEEPWNSAPLNAVMLEQLALAVQKPVAQRTAAEKNYIANMEQYIQWNRQFLAYQSRQAHETWKIATATLLADRGQGNLVALYGGVITPPDFAGIVSSSISGSAGLAMLTGAYFSGFVAGKFSFVAPYAAQLAEKAAQAAVGTYITTGGNAASKLMSAASGPVGVAISVIIISAMELDKFVKLDVAESKIRQAVELANMPVDLKVFLQQKDGEAQLGYHWALLTSAETRPSAAFRTRLNILQTGSASGLDLSTVKIGPGIVVENPAEDESIDPDKVMVTIQSTSTIVGQQAASVEPPTASQAQTTAYIQQNKQSATTMRFELSGSPGLCISKLHKHSQGMALRDCDDKGTMWIAPNAKTKTLSFADRYCLVAEGAKPAAGAQVLVSECQAKGVLRQWQLTKEGLVNLVGSQFCMAAEGKLTKDAAIALQKCDPKQSSQIWRPWSATN